MLGIFNDFDSTIVHKATNSKATICDEASLEWSASKASMGFSGHARHTKALHLVQQSMSHLQWNECALTIRLALVTPEACTIVLALSVYLTAQ
eukprot:2366428-Amphidinium_carterae.1